MKTKKITAYIIGGMGAVALLFGIILMFSSKAVSVSAAIVILCISMAFGIMMPNPVSIIGFVAGICMLVFPSLTVGIIMITLGVIMAVANVIISKKKLKLF
ncbi:MAG: hypothetical protein E7600_04975 [Ruminococcaceae bacterium]|nr:hypothetical protein [Oscillospiraceae bacterium]